MTRWPPGAATPFRQAVDGKALPEPPEHRCDQVSGATVDGGIAYRPAASHHPVSLELPGAIIAHRFGEQAAAVL